MKMPLLILLALMAGAFLPLQAGVNGQLKNFLGGPAQAAFVSFGVGTLSLLAYLLVTRASIPASAAGASWWMWVLGGLLGATYVTLIVTLTPILGVALTFGLIVAGQMGAALVFDHFGWLGYTQHPANAARLVGAALIVAGVVVIRKF
jgi:transporter family-2 protein